jgi:hypothetical protein
MALINLRLKLSMARAWFDGGLLDNHQHLLAFQYVNNEQSRLLQFLLAFSNSPTSFKLDSSDEQQ